MKDGFERYAKNTDAFSKDEVLRIQQKRVCVVGCGGLGGHVAGTLARFGVLSLTLVDGDVFSVSNLNRQLFATERNLGENKAEAAKAALADINSDVAVTVYPDMLTETNAAKILVEHDLVMDCLDNRAARMILDRFCGELGIPYIHGAIAGFYGQVACVFPADGTLDKIYPAEADEKPGLENTLGNPPFIPQLVAAVQCSEALKLLAGRGELLRHKMLYIDLLYNDFEVISFSD